MTGGPGRRTLQGDFGSGRSPVIAVRLPKDLHRAVDQLAESSGRSMSAIIREALQWYLEVNPK